MKKILVISTSLRHDSNSDALAEAFAKGAAEAGNEVESITLKGKNLHFCTGCLACQKTQKCVIADDAPAIVDKMYAADVIAFATPIYYYGMSGQLKTECFENARLAGSVFAGGVNAPGDIKGHAEVEAAYQMGKAV